MKTNVKTLAAALVAILAATSPARAQTLDVLKVIPANVDAFAVTSKLGELDKKVSALSKKMGLGVVPLLQTAGAATGIGDGLDKTGSAAVMIFAPIGQKPAVIVAIPTTDFTKIVKGTDAKEDGGVHTFSLLVNGQEMVLAKKGGYALVADAGDRKVLEKVAKSEENIAAQAKSIETWLGAQDIAAVVLEKSLKAYTALGAKLIPDELPGVPPEQQEAVKQQMEWVRGLAKTISEEGTYLAIGGKIDALENVTLGFRAGYTKDGTLAKSAATPKGNALAGLPSDPYAMVFGMALSPDSMKSLMAASAEMNKSTYKLSDEEAKELAKLWGETLKGVESMSMAVQLPKGKAPLFSGTVGVFKVTDAKEFLKNYSDNVLKSNKVMKVPGTATNLKMGDFPAVEMVMDVKSLVKNDVPDADKIFERMFGSDKVTTTLVAVDAKTILMGYIPATKMKQVAAAYATRKVLTADPMTAKTLKLLPENAGLVVLLNPKEIATMVGTLSEEFGGPALPIPMLEETPPLGIGSRSDSTSMEGVIAVPAEIWIEIGRLIRKAKEI